MNSMNIICHSGNLMTASILTRRPTTTSRGPLAAAVARKLGQIAATPSVCRATYPSNDVSPPSRLQLCGMFVPPGPWLRHSAVPPAATTSRHTSKSSSLQASASSSLQASASSSVPAMAAAEVVSVPSSLAEVEHTWMDAAEAAAAAAPPFLDPRDGIRDNDGRLLLRNLTMPELEEWCVSVGEAPKRAHHLFCWLYGNDRWVRHLDEADPFPRAFGRSFKEKVAAGASLSGGITLQSVTSARDGTRKLVFALNAGEGTASGTVETVLIPMHNKHGLNTRYTACVSTQVGCAMNCQFCYTGRMGLMGNLSTAQIVEQVVEARRLLAQEDNAVPIGNIVFMGMGEPLHNYDPVLAAIDILADGLKLSRGKIIVSSVGLVPQIRSFLDTGKAMLALSLHATTDEVRDWIVPTNRRYPISELMAMLKEYYPIEGAPADPHNFAIIEYVMLRGVNDTAADAARLAQLLAPIFCMVNLIMFNPHDGTQFERSDEQDVQAFRRTLMASGKLCTIRVSKGDDTMAACGQLGDLASAARPAPMLQRPEGLRETGGVVVTA